MTRLLTRLVTLLTLLPSAPVLAVSLGDELILSRLGDPVEIEIDVLQWEDMDLDRVQISAATREEYAVFDLTWLPVLEDLRFNLVGPDLDGDVRVLVSSRDPVNEPFLELLLVLRWPGGSLRREYVLLFDPPRAPALSLVEPQPAPEPPVPLPAVVEEEIVAPDLPAPLPAVVAEEAVAPEPAPAVPPVQEAAPLPDARTQVAIDVETLTPQPPAQVEFDATRRSYQIRSGDSLWNIARQFRPAGAGENLYQMLLGIHDLNRGAFINGNISLLKANALLQIPDADDISRIDPLTAEAEFERRWDEGTQRVDAAQRGEPIPLFGNEPPGEEIPVAEAGNNLPPGTEAPNPGDNDDGLIMVSQTNVPQPLHVVTDVDATDDEAAETGAADSRPVAREPETAELQTQPASTVQTVVAEDDRQEAAVVPPAVSTTVQQPVRTRARAVAELETEVVAMRVRRQAAEVVANQFNTALQKAQAERTARESLFGRDNLVLAGSAFALLAALLATAVFSLKIAGDLRLRPGTVGSAMPQEGQRGPVWLNTETPGTTADTERKEPHMPEVAEIERNESQPEVDGIEHIELHMPFGESGVLAGNPAPRTQQAVPGIPHDPNSDELLARLDDLAADDEPNSGKDT